MDIEYNEHNESKNNQTECNTNITTNSSNDTENNEKSIPNESIPNESTPNESTPNESIPNESIPNESTPNESTPTKVSKTKKTEFNSECNHCSKIFKSKLIYDKHISQQLCYSQDEITYCKICCITLSNHNQYKKHLFTIEHLNSIGYNKIERLQTKEVSQVHLADPYLTSNDINKIAHTNLGDSFTFVFNKGNTKTVSLVNNNNNNQDVQNIQIQQKENTIQSQQLQQIQQSQQIQQLQQLQQSQQIQQLQQSQHIINEPTPRQQKIILILNKQVAENTISDCGKTFYKMLDNKLQIDDYKGLQNIITNLQIPDNYKETYLKVVEIFISMLVKETTKGEKLYKDKDISQLVINLTS
jgi:hypothetical protein